MGYMKLLSSLILGSIVFGFVFLGTVSAQETATGSGSLIKVYAAGTSLPTADLIINDVKAASFVDIKGNAEGRQFEEFTYQADTKVTAHQIKVRFSNDIGTRRDLRVDKIIVDNVIFESESESTYVKSESSACGSGFLKTEWLYCDSSFQYDFPITPTPSPTVTPSPSPSPSPTPTPVMCSRKPIGDANCDEKVDLVDFEIWRKEFTSLQYTGFADFDGNGNITAVDFEIWRKTYFKQIQAL